MQVCRSTHPQHRANAYAVLSDDGCEALIVDAGAPLGPLLDELEPRERDAPRVHAVLVTHEHPDHTEHAETWATRFSCPVMYSDEILAAGTLRLGSFTVEGLSTPGHCRSHAALLVSADGCAPVIFSGDVLFAGSVGGTFGFGPDGYERLRNSLERVLFALPEEYVVYPGHSQPTTLRTEEQTNPFVQLMRSTEASTALVRDAAIVGGEQVTVLMESADYDDGTKAIVEFADGRRAIVGGGMLQREVRA